MTGGSNEKTRGKILTGVKKVERTGQHLDETQNLDRHDLEQAYRLKEG